MFGNKNKNKNKKKKELSDEKKMKRGAVTVGLLVVMLVFCVTYSKINGENDTAPTIEDITAFMDGRLGSLLEDNHPGSRPGGIECINLPDRYNLPNEQLRSLLDELKGRELQLQFEHLLNVGAGAGPDTLTLERRIRELQQRVDSIRFGQEDVYARMITYVLDDTVRMSAVQCADLGLERSWLDNMARIGTLERTLDEILEKVEEKRKQ